MMRGIGEYVSFKGSFAKETYNFKEPANRSYPIPKNLNFTKSFLITHFSSNTEMMSEFVPAKESRARTCRQ